MVGVNAIALRGAMRSLRARPAPSRLLQRQLTSTGYPAKENQSFKSQLYESTQQRLKRERAEQEKFAQYQTQSPAGRSAALAFGMFCGDISAFSLPWIPSLANWFCDHIV